MCTFLMVHICSCVYICVYVNVCGCGGRSFMQCVGERQALLEFLAKDFRVRFINFLFFSFFSVKLSSSRDYIGTQNILGTI